MANNLQRMLGRARFLSLVALFLVLAICLTFSWTTRDAMAHLPFLRGGARASVQTTIVDLHPWQIAQALAPLAGGPRRKREIIVARLRPV